MYSRLLLAALSVMAVLAVNEMLYKTKELYRLVFADVISMKDVLTVWAALMPVVIYHVGPEMVVVALLVRYYLWRQHNEILTLRTMGMSCWQIAFPGLAVGICIGLFAAVMSMFVLPMSIGAAEAIRSAAETHITPRMLEEGVQNSILPGLSLSFQRRRTADVIDSVVVTDDRKDEEFSFVIAERGRFVNIDEVYVLVLEKGNQFNHLPSGEVRQVAFDQLQIPLTDGTMSAPKQGRGFYEESIGNLLDPPDEVRQNPRLLAAWVTEGHHRVINPLRCIACALLLLGVLVPGLQGYVELLVRLGLAVALSFAENSASTMAFAMAQRRAEAAPFLYLLPLISGGTGALLLCAGDRHLQRWARRLNFRRSELRGAEAGGYATGATLAVRSPLE